MQKINNNKFLIRNNYYFVKKYSKDRESSYKRELYFYNFFKNYQNINIPRIMSKKKNKSITFKYYPFNKNISQKKYFKALLNFFILTNKKNKKVYVMNSKEMHSSIPKLKKNIYNRIKAIKKSQKKNKEINLIIDKLLNSIPKKNPFENFDSKKFVIISPSDIGIHNAGSYKDKIFFFDFEYAGKDHIVKFICDTYYQPELNVNKNLFKKFLNKIQKHMKINIFKALTTYEPYYKAKMILIILKVFDPKSKFNILKKNNIRIIKNERLKKAFLYINKKSITSLIK